MYGMARDYVPVDRADLRPVEAHGVWAPRRDGTVGALRVGALRIALGGDVLEYDWEAWNSVPWHERRKAGWAPLARASAR